MHTLRVSAAARLPKDVETLHLELHPLVTARPQVHRMHPLHPNLSPNPNPNPNPNPTPNPTPDPNPNPDPDPDPN